MKLTDPAPDDLPGLVSVWRDAALMLSLSNVMRSISSMFPGMDRVRLLGGAGGQFNDTLNRIASYSGSEDYEAVANLQDATVLVRHSGDEWETFDEYLFTHAKIGPDGRMATWEKMDGGTK